MDRVKLYAVMELSEQQACLYTKNKINMLENRGKREDIMSSNDTTWFSSSITSIHLMNGKNKWWKEGKQGQKGRSSRHSFC